MAHEVNTPLAVISTYAQMLAKQVANDEQKTVLLDKIARQTFRASEIVNSLLNFSRTSTTDFGDVNLNKVIQETLSLLEHQLKKAGVQIKAELDPELPADPRQCGQAAAGLSQSVPQRARRHGPRRRAGSADLGRRIGRARGRERHRRRASRPNTCIRFTIRSSPPKAARKGTGLGLAVTYGIIQEHGGSIEVSNRRAGGARSTWNCRGLRSEASARKVVNASEVVSREVDIHNIQRQSAGDRR